jgi:hypothetical protein
VRAVLTRLDEQPYLTKEQALADLRISSEVPRGLPEGKAVPDSFDTSNIDTTLDGDSREDEAVSNASSIHDGDIEAILKNLFPADLESMKSGTVPTTTSLAGRSHSPLNNTSVLAAGSVEEPEFNRLRDAKGNRATKNLYVFGYGPGVSPQLLIFFLSMLPWWTSL